MDLQSILLDKQISAKEKTETISGLLLENNINMDEIMQTASLSNDTAKATCIEAIEYATKIKPTVATLACLKYVSKTLKENAPRIKWESAKVIGNIAHLYPNKLDEAIKNLLVNTESNGTVVRWSAAFALGEILKLHTSINKTLIPTIKTICDREEKISIKKIYLSALKKI
jgi:hypothetical protein